MQAVFYGLEVRNPGQSEIGEKPVGRRWYKLVARPGCVWQVPEGWVPAQVLAWYMEMKECVGFDGAMRRACCFRYGGEWHMIANGLDGSRGAERSREYAIESDGRGKEGWVEYQPGAGAINGE